MLAFASEGMPRGLSPEVDSPASRHDRARRHHIVVRIKSDCGIASALVLHDAGARTPSVCTPAAASDL